MFSTTTPPSVGVRHAARCRENILYFFYSKKYKIFSIKISTKFLYNFFINKKIMRKEWKIVFFWWKNHGADFIFQKMKKKWATRGPRYSPYLPPEVCKILEKGPVEALFGLVWGGYPLFIIKKCAKNDWKKGRWKKSVFFDTKKVHIFALFGGPDREIGVDMIPATDEGFSGVFFIFFIFEKMMKKIIKKNVKFL